MYAQIHGESISQNILLRDKARTLLALQASVWMKVDELLQNVKCIVGFVALEVKCSWQLYPISLLPSLAV